MRAESSTALRPVRNAEAQLPPGGTPHRAPRNHIVSSTRAPPPLRPQQAARSVRGPWRIRGRWRARRARRGPGGRRGGGARVSHSTGRRPRAARGQRDAAVALSGELPEDGEGAPVADRRARLARARCCYALCRSPLLPLQFDRRRHAGRARRGLAHLELRPERSAPGLAPRSRSRLESICLESGFATCSSSRRSSAGIW